MLNQGVQRKSSRDYSLPQKRHRADQSFYTEFSTSTGRHNETTSRTNSQERFKQMQKDFGPSSIMYREPKLSNPPKSTLSTYERKRPYFPGCANFNQERSSAIRANKYERDERYSRIMEELGGIEDTISSTYS